MIHRMLRYPADWEWHVVQLAHYRPLADKPLPSRKESARHDEIETVQRNTLVKPKLTEEQEQTEAQIAELKHQFPECALWIDESVARRTNHISVDDLPGEGTILCGTLMLQVTEEQSDVQPFHFWLSRKRLVSMHDDMRIPLRLQSGSHSLKYNECSIAPEAFFIMISVILETFHAGLDGFERRLGELEKTMRNQNTTGLLDVIFERRYDLLHWSHLFIPVREVHGAAKEAFGEELNDKDAFVRISHKLERIDTLLKHYALEIDTLISMDDAISSFRGNDIMKTLTIFTVLFLPATIAGTLMGSNFDRLPFRDLPWGFAAMMTGIILITIGIYIWLWKKGWTGDLLNKRSGPLFILEPNESEGRSKRRGSRNKRMSSTKQASNDNEQQTEKELPSRSQRKRM
ncbi:CorA family divalent cation transporter [Paenibacillus sp. GCM10027627]|uniref:CorA family divalent cation transporter n=1 Tax=unclassified Paenibacillus TaxID=185978 RepID=UPI0036285398